MSRPGLFGREAAQPGVGHQVAGCVVVRESREMGFGGVVVHQHPRQPEWRGRRLSSPRKHAGHNRPPIASCRSTSGRRHSGCSRATAGVRRRRGAAEMNPAAARFARPNESSSKSPSARADESKLDSRIAPRISGSSLRAWIDSQQAAEGRTRFFSARQGARRVANFATAVSIAIVPGFLPILPRRQDRSATASETALRPLGGASWGAAIGRGRRRFRRSDRRRSGGEACGRRSRW